MKVQPPGAPNYSVLIWRFKSSRQWDRVVDTAREWLAQEPENTEAHLAISQALINLKRHPEAESHLARALARQPANAVAHRWMSIIQFHQKKFKAADESIQQALSLAPQDAYNWYHLAWMLYKHGDSEAARKYAGKALELSPRDPDTINLLALCTPKNQSAEIVLNHYRHALSIDPEKPVVHNNIGVYHLNVDKDYAAAEESFRRALFFDPTLKVARTNLFVALKRRDKVYRALCAPKDFIYRFFGFTRARRRQSMLLYLLALPLWILAFRFVLGGLILWGLLVWPMVKAYEYITIGDIRAEAGELGARRGGLFGFRRWPLRLRLGLFGLLLLAFWGGVAGLAVSVSRENPGDPAQQWFGLIIFPGLLILLAVWIMKRWRAQNRRFAARRRAKKFDRFLASRTGEQA
jgi:Flp pilus assembly protein TadD